MVAGDLLVGGGSGGSCDDWTFEWGYAGGMLFLARSLPTSGHVGMATADALFSDAENSGPTGYAVAGGDVSGDGLADFLVTAPATPYNGNYLGGTVYLFYSGFDEGSPFAVVTAPIFARV